MRRHAAPIFVALLAAPTLAQTPSFNLVGAPAGSTDSRVLGLSADGTVAAGGSALSNGTAPGFTWTLAGGRVDYGLLPGMPNSSGASGISGDGSVVVGGFLALGPPPQTTAHPFRWAGSGPLQDLGLVANYTRGRAEGVNGDGSVIVGHDERGPNTQYDGQAFRWTGSGGMQGLGFALPGDFFSAATAISRSGGTIVGVSQNSNTGSSVPFVWTQASGMRALPGLPGSPFRADAASGVNADGTVVVGSCAAAPTGNVHPTEWLGNTNIDLGLPAGYFSGSAEALSDDGTVIVGAISAGTLQLAGVWTSQGPSTLSNYLAANGVQVPAGWSLINCSAVSANGETFAGWASTAGGFPVGFIATVPAPSGMLLLIASSIFCVNRRR